MSDFNFLDYCIPCGTWCCKGESPYLSEAEKKRISLNKITQKEGGDCRFLEDKLCNIHKDRPFECIIFPYDILEVEGELSWVLWGSCPVHKAIPKDHLENLEAQMRQRYSLSDVKNYVNYHKTNQPEKYGKEKYSKIRKISWK